MIDAEPILTECAGGTTDDNEAKMLIKWTETIGDIEHWFGVSKYPYHRHQPSLDTSYLIDHFKDTYGSEVDRLAQAIRPHELVIERSIVAMRLMKDTIEMDRLRRGGKPVLAGTRFDVSQVFGELADGRSTKEMAEDYSFDEELVKRLLCGLAIYLDRDLSQ
jgi:uncharacterized protein (DUF433 family)